MADVHAYALRRCATTGERGRSAGRTRFQLTPDSASGDRVEREICTARRCRCRCSAGVRQRRRSAAHVRRCVCPRRCRGLTEDETARAVRFRTTARDDEVRRARSGSATTAIGDVVCRARSDSATTAIGDEVRRARSGSATTAIGDEVRRARSDSASGGVAHLRCAVG